jgi:hypothetical protein
MRLVKPYAELADIEAAFGPNYWFAETTNQGVELKEMMARLSDRGIRAVCIDLSEVRSRYDVFDAFAKELSFPDYFGRNWAALKDCLFDLDWLHESSAAVAILGGSSFRKTHPRWFKILYRQITEIDEITIGSYLQRKLLIVMNWGD